MAKYIFLPDKLSVMTKFIKRDIYVNDCRQILNYIPYIDIFICIKGILIT